MANMVQGRFYIVDGAQVFTAELIDAATPLARLVVQSGPCAGQVNVSAAVAAVASVETVGSTDPLYAYGAIKTGNADGEKWFVMKAYALAGSPAVTPAVSTHSSVRTRRTISTCPSDPDGLFAQ